MEDLNAPIDMAAHIRDTKESLAEIEEDVHCLLKMNKGGEKWEYGEPEFILTI